MICRRFMAIVAEAKESRFISLLPERRALRRKPDMAPESLRHCRSNRSMNEGKMVSALRLCHALLIFSPSRQLIALTTFSDLVMEATQSSDSQTRCSSGFSDDDRAIADGQGSDASAYADAVATYLGICSQAKSANRNSASLHLAKQPAGLSRRLAGKRLPMAWDFAETNPLPMRRGFSSELFDSVCEVLENCPMALRGT